MDTILQAFRDRASIVVNGRLLVPTGTYLVNNTDNFRGYVQAIRRTNLDNELIVSISARKTDCELEWAHVIVYI